MSNYAYVENNEVTKIHGSLPKSWKNISGFNLLEGDTAALISHGWYPIQEAAVAWDPNTHYVSEKTYTVNADHVLSTPVLVEYTAEELQQIRDRFFDMLRRERDTRLEECDWTMMPDVTENQTPEWINSWKVYRQELRDLPATLAGTTDYDIDNVAWPIAPGV